MDACLADVPVGADITDTCDGHSISQLDIVLRIVGEKSLWMVEPKGLSIVML